MSPTTSPWLAPRDAWGEDPAPKRRGRGVERVVDPAETLARVRPWLPMMGITRVANVTGLDHLGVPVVMVTRPNARSLSVSQGKGLTLDAAKASGVMECVELFHAERPPLPLRLGSQVELQHALPLVDVSRLPKPADSVFHPHKRVAWVEGRELLSGQARWLPYECVHADGSVPLPPGSGCFVLSSNGLASGNHPLEALCHGLWELIERHCDAVRVAPARVDLGSVDDPACRGVIERFEAAGLALGVWDIHLPGGPACFRCMAVDAEPEPLRRLYPAVGMGCHPRRAHALLRALTEAAQARLTFISGSRDDLSWSVYEEVRDPALLQRARARLAAPAERVRFQELPSVERGSFAEEAEAALGWLETLGIREVVAVELTRAPWHLPVIKVVAPGLSPSRGHAE